LAHEIVKRIIDYRLSLGRIHLSSGPLSIYHPEGDTDGCPYLIKLGYQERATLSFAAAKRVVVKKHWGEVFASRVEEIIQAPHQAQSGRRIEGSTCNALLSAIFRA
jgi:hypothetical protein